MSTDLIKKISIPTSGYRALLKLNPRCAWQDCHTKVWELFLSGIAEDEFKGFVSYLGKQFRIPRSEEWLALLHSSAELRSLKAELMALCPASVAPPARHWLANELFPLTEEGLLEWIDDEEQLCCIGKPYKAWYSTEWFPYSIREVNWNDCRQLVGFRVVKEISE